MDLHILVNDPNPFIQISIGRSIWSFSRLALSCQKQTIIRLIFYFLKVEGQGFKVDASRLTTHSDFLRKMLFDGEGHLGVPMDGMKEGTVDNPIVVLGCTAGMFANFLGWLNHK
jgi:hypothetical protein